MLHPAVRGHVLDRLADKSLRVSRPCILAAQISGTQYLCNALLVMEAERGGLVGMNCPVPTLDTTFALRRVDM